MKDKNNEHGFKHILNNANGHVRPGEMVAILGPSGSGKTSLLNVLAGRIRLSKGSKYSGDIKFNDTPHSRDKFGNIGAFVQQDDILLGTMTPKELFSFSLQMTSTLSSEEVKARVDALIERLRLDSCQNTLFGSKIIKGLSGGEKKRTSIGYELITNPSVLLLDEPTSGLDSTTSYSICKLLKQEAKRGMTILATIH